MMQRVKLYTEISQAYWYIQDGLTAKFLPAEIALGETKPRNVSWLDNLFDGGIVLPTDKEEPLTFVISGPPGSGKTTLALELCYRLARNESKLNEQNMHSVYLSLDADSDRIIENAESFGWKDTNQSIIKFRGRKPDVQLVTVWGREQLHDWENLYLVVESALQEISVKPDVLVIDSLNVLDAPARGNYFWRFLRSTARGTKIVIFLLDTGFDNQPHSFWEYACDNLIRMDYTTIHDYYIRTIEVVKARYQSHVWGKHQLKVYSKPGEIDRNASDYRIRIQRAHPYREEGGIFIFPSLHYYLSVYKRQSSMTADDPVRDLLPTKLSEVVKLPRGRCTAFIGDRGGHKSHLGYLNLLHRIINHDESGLVISLRDDEGMTKKTMNIILEQEEALSAKKQTLDLAKYEREEQLEILYFPPGYITPEEFFHRMFIGIKRLKRKGKRLNVLFNSLDQLAARFPLCAKQEIFVPAIIEVLTGENITSIFIAVDEPGQPVEQYGLLPMSDLILSFYRRSFEFDSYYKHLNEVWNLEGQKGGFGKRIAKIKEQQQLSTREEVVVEVVRYAGGQKGGARGLLELVDQAHLNGELHEKPGLHFTKLSQMFPHGKLVRGVS